MTKKVLMVLTILTAVLSFTVFAQDQAAPETTTEPEATAPEAAAPEAEAVPEATEEAPAAPEATAEVPAEADIDFFVTWDTDGTGSLSKEEFVAGYNADIPGSEYEQTLGAGANVDDLFTQADVDGNQEISADEWVDVIEMLGL